MRRRIRGHTRGTWVPTLCAVHEAHRDHTEETNACLRHFLHVLSPSNVVLRVPRGNATLRVLVDNASVRVLVGMGLPVRRPPVEGLP